MLTRFTPNKAIIIRFVAFFLSFFSRLFVVACAFPPSLTYLLYLLRKDLAVFSSYDDLVQRVRNIGVKD